MNTRIISTILVFFFPIFCFAQMEFVETVPLYPTLPFNLKETIKNNFKLVSVVHDVYQKSEGDESGFTWSNQVSSYQYARYIIKDKTLFNASFYDTENDKISSNEYHYIDGLISAIEFSSYDSLQEGKVKYAFHYAYRDSLPYQKVLMFNDDKSFRHCKHRDCKSFLKIKNVTQDSFTHPNLQCVFVSWIWTWLECCSPSNFGIKFKLIHC